MTIDRFTGFGIVAAWDGNMVAANSLGTDPTGTIDIGQIGVTRPRPTPVEVTRHHR